MNAINDFYNFATADFIDFNMKSKKLNKPRKMRTLNYKTKMKRNVYLIMAIKIKTVCILCDRGNFEKIW